MSNFPKFGLYHTLTNLFVYFFVFSLCFERLTLNGVNLDFVLTKYFSFILVLLSLFNLNFWKGLLVNKSITIYLIIYFIILTFSSFINKSLFYNSYFDYLFLLNVFLFLSLRGKFICDSSVFMRSQYLFIIGNILLSVLYFLGVGKSFITHELESRATIFGNNQNYLGLSLSIASLFIFRFLFIEKTNLGLKIFFGISLLPISYFMVLTGSRTAFLSFICGVFIFIFLSSKLNLFKKIITAISSFIFIVTILVVFNDKFDISQRIFSTIESGDTANRDVIWSGLIYLFSDYFLLGVGKTGYLRMIGDLSPHNAFIEVFIYTGLIGSLFFIAFLASLLANSLKTYNKTRNFFPIILFVAVLGILLTGQFFDQKLVWFFVACMFERSNYFSLT